MMNILEMVLASQNGGAVKQLGQQFGLGDDQALEAVRQLVPALSGGLKRNIAQPGGLDDLAGALQRQDHARYYDDPRSLERDDAVAEGNAILGHVFGSKDVSREVASRAAERTGIDDSTLKKMLPVVASLVMGSLSRGTGNGLSSGGGEAAGGMGSLLTSFLDADKDGSIADDLLGIAGKFFR